MAPQTFALRVLPLSQTAQHCVTSRGPRRQAHLKPKTKQTIDKVVCRPAPARITSSTSTVIRSASRVYSRTASSSCHLARVTQGILPANVFVKSVALAHCHLLSILFSRRGRPWNAAGRELLLPQHPVSTWSYTARQTSEGGWHVASEALLHPRGPFPHYLLHQALLATLRVTLFFIHVARVA